MEYKAKFIKAVRDTNPFNTHSWEHTELLYEYRGYEYFVTKDNNGCMGTPLYIQHQEAQKEIDKRIEQQNKPTPEWKYEGSAQEGFDLFYKYLEGDEND